MGKAFKYASKIDAIPDCPASHYREADREAFRFVRSEDIDGSFLPVLALSPVRALTWNDKDRCEGWTLSFFISESYARHRFRQLRSVVSNIRKSLGDSIAKGEVTASDGISSEADEDGHFELHEYADSALASRFHVVARVD